MTRYLIRRIAAMIPVLILVSLITFAVVQILPGDVALAILGEELAKDDARYEAMREKMGLDKPLLYRYLVWITNALRGDFGTSLRTGEPVGTALKHRLVPTLQLTMGALLISVLVGIPAGIISAVKRDSALDVIGTILSLFGVALPSFWFGILMIFFFSLVLGWLPSSGFVPLWEDPARSLRLMIMPSVALSTGLAAIVQRQTRSALLEVLREDYVRTAHSKGLRWTTVVFRHAVRNALIPVITVVSMQVGRLFGGALTLEVIFAIPGMGRLAVDSIFFRDFVMLQGIMLVTASIVLFVNLVTDVVYAFLDPRIRYE